MNTTETQIPSRRPGPLSPAAAVRVVRDHVESWNGVTVHRHRFGGIEFRLGRRELGHLHDGAERAFADLPFPRRVHDELVCAGRARNHHVLPDSGWVTAPLATAAEIVNVVGLFELSYERAVAKQIPGQQR